MLITSKQNTNHSNRPDTTITVRVLIRMRPRRQRLQQAIRPRYRSYPSYRVSMGSRCPHCRRTYRPISCVPCVVTMPRVSTMVCARAKAARDFSSEPCRKTPNTSAWQKRIARSTSVVVIVANTVAFKNVWQLAWSKKVRFFRLFFLQLFFKFYKFLSL
jgi:hypothetical protein